MADRSLDVLLKMRKITPDPGGGSGPFLLVDFLRDPLPVLLPPHRATGSGFEKKNGSCIYPKHGLNFKTALTVFELQTLPVMSHTARSGDIIHLNVGGKR